MPLYIASDHGGFQLKKYLVRFLKNQLKRAVDDLGPEKYDETDDYPMYAAALAKKISKDKKTKGILICKTAHGVCMVANKIKGVRAIVGYSIEGAEWGRRHEDANVLCLASKYISDEHAAMIVKKFLETEFDGEERLVRRLKEMERIEK